MILKTQSVTRYGDITPEQQLSVHNTAQNSSDNLPSYLQTTIIAQMFRVSGLTGKISAREAYQDSKVQREAELNTKKVLTAKYIIV